MTPKQEAAMVFREIKVGEYVLRFWPSDNGWMCGITPEMMQALAEPKEKYQYGTPLLDAMTGKTEQPSNVAAVNTSSERVDKTAENVHEQPAQQEPKRWAVFCQGCRKEWSVSYPHPGKSICADCDDKLAKYDASPQPAQQQEPVAWYGVNIAGVKYLGWKYEELDDRGFDVFPLYTSPQPSKPLTDEQRKAIVVCFTSGKVSVSEVQRKLAISYNEAQQLCQSIVDLGLAQGLQLAPSLDRHGIKGDA